MKKRTLAEHIELLESNLKCHELDYAHREAVLLHEKLLYATLEEFERPVTSMQWLNQMAHLRTVIAADKDELELLSALSPPPKESR